MKNTNKGKNGTPVWGTTSPFPNNTVPVDYTNFNTDAPGMFSLYLHNGYCFAESGILNVDTSCSTPGGEEKPGKALNSNNRNNDVLIDMNLTKELQYVQKDDWHININPNPTNNHVNVQTEFSAECIVYNIHGIVVAQYNFDSTINYKVDVSSLPNGVYIFEFRSKNSETNFSGKKSIKVVKY